LNWIHPRSHPKHSSMRLTVRVRFVFCIVSIAVCKPIKASFFHGVVNYPRASVREREVRSAREQELP